MKRLLLIAALLFANAVNAAVDHPLITKLLTQDKAPPGVVFEIVTGDAAGLDWAVPQVANYAKRLRERFPKLEIAIVTHGQEMFALQKNQKAVAPEAHAGIEQLVKAQNIPVHVCETYAGWRGISAEAFPDYVNVSPAGPTQVKLYMELGYVRVKISSAINGKPVQ